MSQAALFAQSLLIGLSIAAPVGPIGLLVIQRTLQRGARVGLATGLGAAAADALYGAVGAFGVTRLIDALAGARVPLALGGGAFLLWLAWRIWHSAPATQPAQAGGGAGLPACFAGSFALTLSNPATIFSFIAVFGTLGARVAGGSPWTMIAGVLAGSALWWLLLSTAVGRLRTRFDARVQAWVNRASALLLAGFALWQWLWLWLGLSGH
ncbi:MAG TPA: LysE family transporter [Rubrivivax sp.]|nr:LysE family transporter [Rubrivivax sp.]